MSTPLTFKKSQTVDEFAEYLGVVRLTVRREIKRGNLKAVRVGRSVRITPAAAEAYLAANEVVRP
jgi:excisionase family DNA binding protein